MKNSILSLHLYFLQGPPCNTWRMKLSPTDHAAAFERPDVDLSIIGNLTAVHITLLLSVVTLIASILILILCCGDDSEQQQTTYLEENKSEGDTSIAKPTDNSMAMAGAKQYNNVIANNVIAGDNQGDYLNIDDIGDGVYADIDEGGSQVAMSVYDSGYKSGYIPGYNPYGNAGKGKTPSAPGSATVFHSVYDETVYLAQGVSLNSSTS